MREIEDDDIHIWKRRLERCDRGLVRPVADSDQQRPLVEPERVATFDRRGLLEASDERHPRSLEGRSERVRLRAAPFLARPEKDGAIGSDEHRVVHVDRVRIAGVVVGHDDLGARTFEELAEQLVLACGCGGIGCRAPAVLAPASHVLDEGRSHEDAPQLPGHRCAAEPVHPRDATRTTESRSLDCCHTTRAARCRTSWPGQVARTRARCDDEYTSLRRIRPFSNGKMSTPSHSRRRPSLVGCIRGPLAHDDAIAHVEPATTKRQVGCSSRRSGRCGLVRRRPPLARPAVWFSNTIPGAWYETILSTSWAFHAAL